ncbi:MAG: alpha/beta hydrolase [Thermodesulfobacteriota bacterium]|nr:alpha/beta hydrolase [Thermodesulfobacteriota bacterium]
MAEIISRNVSVGECTIHGLETKGTEGHEVLLLHGAKFQAATWKKLATLDRLDGAGYRPHAIDLPGFGKSPRCAVAPERVLQAFIEKQKLSRPVLVGPSMSGRISLDFALKYPELVGGLVLIGAVGVRERSEQLDAIRVPCLILWGSNDAIAPLASARLLHGRIPGAELRIFDGAGHPCYLDQPDLWHEELLSFLHKNFT